MTEALQYRLTGAVILVLLMVIFLPILFDGKGYQALQQANYSASNSGSAPIIFNQDFPEFEQDVIIRKGVPSNPYSKPMSSSSNKLKNSEKKLSNTSIQQWIVQVGNFADNANAHKLQNQLKAKGFNNVHQQQIKANNQLVHSVRLGPFDKPQATDIAEKLLQKLNIKALIKPAHNKSK